MANTGEGQEDSRSLVRQQRVLFYTLRRFNKSQRRGGPGRSTGRDGGTSVWVSRDTGGPQGGPTPVGFPGPVILDDLGRVVALLRRVLGILSGKLSAVQRECSLSACGGLVWEGFADRGARRAPLCAVAVGVALPFATKVVIQEDQERFRSA